MYHVFKKVPNPHAEMAPIIPLLEDRPTLEDTFFDLARVMSNRATCPRAQIGCVLVAFGRFVISTGYNGAPTNEPHCTDEGCIVFGNHCVRAVHAEINALKQARMICAAWLQTEVLPENFMANLNVIAYIVGGRDCCAHCCRELYNAGVIDVRSRLE